jgi:ATP-dependent Clp protease ATP-binding subunit ClpB
MAAQNQATTSRLNEIEKELAGLTERRTQLRSHWEHEKKLIKSIRAGREEIEQLRIEADQSERQSDLGKVAEIRYGRIPQIENELRLNQEELGKLQKDHAMLKEVVGPEDIAEIVAKWTGIPVSKMLESEREKLLKMEDRLHERVIGQDEAVTALSSRYAG